MLSSTFSSSGSASVSTTGISYNEIKASNQAKEAEKQRIEKRKRAVLFLILNHLYQNGYQRTAEQLEKECHQGSNGLRGWTIADNMDLMTIVQEFEAYYQIKFSKAPKLIRKVGGNDEVGGKYQNNIKIDKVRDTSLKRLKRGSGGVDVGKEEKDLLEKKAIENYEDFINDQMKLVGTQCLNSNEDLKSKKVSKEELYKTVDEINVEDSIPFHERLLKPIPEYENQELKDLASIITRDIYTENPNVAWSDIAGLSKPKKLIKEAIVYPSKYPQLFTGILSPWKGILLYGPPGTGKTMLAKAVATECKTTFFNISATSIVSKWRGDSEKLVRTLFELAKYHAPSTIFIDELESVMSKRSSGNNEHEGSRRMKTELLIQLDGIVQSPGVFVLAACNMPWDLDMAILRRMEKRIWVDFPNEKSREDMFLQFLPPNSQLKNVTTGSQPIFVNNLDYTLLSKATEGYSGADIKLVCKEAAMRPLRRIFDQLDIVESPSPIHSRDNMTLNNQEIKSAPKNKSRSKDIRKEQERVGFPPIPNHYQTHPPQDIVVKDSAETLSTSKNRLHESSIDLLQFDPVTMEDVLAAIASTKPSCPPNIVDKYSKWEATHGSI